MANASFLPEDYVERRAQRRTNLLSLILFVVVMAGVVGAFFVTDHQRTEVRQLQAQVNAQFEEAARRLEQLDELQARKDQMIRKARVSAALLERVPRTLVLSELINNMPSTMSLLELELSTRVVQGRPTAATALDKAKADARVAALPEPEVPPTEVTVALVGVAPTDLQVSQFMTDLGRCPLFANIDLAFSEETRVEDQAMRRFRIAMTVRQDVEVDKIEPTKVARRPNPMVPAPSVQIISPAGAPAVPAGAVPVSDRR